MTRFLLFLAGVAATALPLAAAGAAEPAHAPDCSAPRDIVEDEPRLPGLAQQLRGKHPVTIVAIGGASTAGNATGNAAEDSYPRRLEDALRQRHPGIDITVVNKGVPRQTTQEMVERFPRDVYPLAPSLVIWETGTFDAARSYDIDLFADALEAGLADLRAHNLETMLIDMQYSRGTASVINFEPYLEAMRRIADVEDVYLFQRFEIMKYWSDNGVFSFGDVPKELRAQLAIDVYKCLAEQLAEAIDYAAR
jgi:lysophospholipase L1-like esterase